MRRARPSTMAVLPTPGSPMSTGLFLVRRDSTWMTRRISSSRPMTGSSLPRRRPRSGRGRTARAPGTSPRGSRSVTRWLPRTSFSAPSTASCVTPSERRRSPTRRRPAHREQQVLGREVVVAEVGALRVGRLEHPERVGCELGLLRWSGRTPVGNGRAPPRCVRAPPGRHAEPFEHARHRRSPAATAAPPAGAQG